MLCVDAEWKENDPDEDMKTKGCRNAGGGRLQKCQHL